MKKLIYLFLTVLIVACSSDDSSDDSNSIEGRWNLTSTDLCSNPQGFNSCRAQSYITFNNGVAELFNYYEDGVGNPCELQENSTFNYSTDSNIPNTYYLDAECNDDPDIVTLKVNGNTLSTFQECGDCTLQVASAVFTRD
tara:strand:- start:448 stop:867 length:420 start_codon:yes stop_codon:yes gene_type:complete